MEFNSIPFLALFALTALLSYTLGEKFRVAMLLLASTLFYCFWRVDHGILVAALIFVDFIAARRMGNLKTGRKRNIWFSLGITANLGSLFLFKYSTLLAGPLRLLTGSRASSGEPFLELAAPVGISYFVLKKMAYLIDVHRGALVPERKFHHYALYVAFFPVALAGPLDLPAPLLSQFARPAPFDYSRVSGGLKLMAWGLFKKLVVADRLAVFVDAVFDSSGPGNRRAGAGRHRAFHRPVVRRLLGLYRPGHWFGTGPGDHRGRQFQPALYGAFPGGILATLAHFPVNLAAPLLFFARFLRRSAHFEKRKMGPLPGHRLGLWRSRDADHDRLRFVARSALDICSCGGHCMVFSCCCPSPRVAGEKGCASGFSDSARP